MLTSYDQNERIIVGRSTGSTAGRQRTLSAMTSWLIADYACPRASVLKRYQLRETKVTTTGRGKERKRETRKRQKKKTQLVTRSGYATIIDYRGLSLNISFSYRVFIYMRSIFIYDTVHRVHVAYHALI